MSDTPQPPAPTQVGDTKEEIGPGFLTLLSPGPAEVEPTEASPDSTGRRTALARWLTDPDNPLTARVMVNRIWQYHFGEGLAAASNDFGRLGEKPSHPELLDYLATRFVEGGWSIKAMHRRIMNSAVYRQSATHPRPEAAAGKDPGNRLRWRAEVHRLDAEQVRDAMLVAGGELDLSMGGPSVNGDRPRRSVYTRVRRNRPDPLLHAFDAVGGFTSTPQRNVTTTATQALLMINGDWPLSQAKAMADRLREMELGGDEARVAEAYRLAFGRPPESTERAEAVAFLDRQADRMIEEQQRADPATGVTGTVPSRSGRAARLEPGSEQDRLEIPDHPSLPEGDFTVEAVIFLDSLYGDATVRTIISQWDNNHSTPGWAFGVTSEQSAYEPRNLILQLVGDTAGGERTYEVIASNLRPELNTPYYVAVSVDLDRTEEGGVTFYMKNLSSDDAKLHAAFVPHKVRGSIDREGVPVVIGGRDGQDRHLWDGLIDDVRISNTPLPREQLLLYDDATADETAGFWRFEDRPGFYKDSSGRANHIRSGAEPGDIRHAALIDLCHALLNANEFLYVD